MAPGSKPLPSTSTYPPGATRPGLSTIAGPAPAATGWPPSVTVGVGVGGTDGAAGLDAELLLELAGFPVFSVSTWAICHTITMATAMPMTAFQLNFFLPGGRPPPLPERVSLSRAVKP